MRRMDETDLPARFRAAQAYAGLKLDDAAELVGLSGRQWSRYLNGEAGPDITEKVADKYAELGVPRWFITGGWDAEERDPSLAEKVEALDNRYKTLKGQYDALDKRVERILSSALASALPARTEARGADIGEPSQHHQEELREGEAL